MKLRILLVVFCLYGCSNNPEHSSSVMSAKECEKSRVCAAQGMLEMRSDGHAYIGKLTLEDGSCIDVSLPDSQSRRLLGEPEKYLEVHGLVLPYPYGEDIAGFEVNGRQIGFGQCGSFYVFVK